MVLGNSFCFPGSIYFFEYMQAFLAENEPTWHCHDSKYIRGAQSSGDVSPINNHYGTNFYKGSGPNSGNNYLVSSTCAVDAAILNHCGEYFYSFVPAVGGVYPAEYNTNGWAYYQTNLFTEDLISNLMSPEELFVGIGFTSDWDNKRPKTLRLTMPNNNAYSNEDQVTCPLARCYICFVGPSPVCSQ